MRQNALILMAKAPAPGEVKTRLCPPLSPRSAASLYRRLLLDAAEELGRVRGARLLLFHAPPGAAGRFRAAPFRPFALAPQAGRDLGERMESAAGEAFRGGARRVVIAGADCPALSASRVGEAFRELSAGAAAVFGPSVDGGFYLAGLRFPPPPVFRGVTWGTPSALGDVVARCAALALPYALLPPERDVDTAEDLDALAAWAGRHARPACPRTRRWLSGRAGSPAGAATPPPAG